MMTVLFLFLVYIFYAGFVFMVGLVYPFMGFSEVAESVFSRVERESFYPRNLWAFLAAAMSYVLFAGLLFFFYVGVGYLAGLFHQRPGTTALVRFMMDSNDNLCWRALDGLVISATVAIVVALIVFTILIAWNMVQFVAWLFRR